MMLTIADLQQIKDIVKDIVKNEIEPIKNYIKRDSDIYEMQSTDILLDLLHAEYFQTCDIKKMNLRQLYNKDGSELTDLDGCILVKWRDCKNNAINSQELRRLTIQQAQSRKKDLPTGGMPARSEKYMFVMESKKNFYKSEIDNKILQMIAFEKVLKYIKRRNFSNTSATGKFREFVVENETELEELPSCIKRLYFCVPYLSKELQKYIMLLNNGQMTKDTYEQMTFDMFNSNKEFSEAKFMGMLKYRFSPRYPINNFSKLTNALHDALDYAKIDVDFKRQYEKKINNALMFCKEYDSSQNAWCRKKLGLIISNKEVEMEQDIFKTCEM